jgi:hypothetical protein
VNRKACDIGEGDKLVNTPNGKTRCLEETIKAG